MNAERSYPPANNPPQSTLMLQEALSAPNFVATLLDLERENFNKLGERLRSAPPKSVLTIARGSSDHASAYMAYLIMVHMGRLVTSLPMSLVTLYQSRIVCDGLLSVAFSQSGQSPDLVAPTRSFREDGARTLAFVNDPESPLAQAAEHVIPLHAGAERSIAATKSFIAQLVAGIGLVAAWKKDVLLLKALEQLPANLERAATMDWSPAVQALVNAERLFVIGRGTCLPIALEAALKFKETCGIQAEAFSSAEVKHGPMALIDEDYPLLVFAPRGPAQASLLALADEMRSRSRRVLLAAPPDIAGVDLPLIDTGSEDLNPIAAIQSFYPMVEALARARGLNPDQPPHLAKVTKTH